MASKKVAQKPAAPDRTLAVVTPELPEVPNRPPFAAADSRYSNASGTAHQQLKQYYAREAFQAVLQPMHWILKLLGATGLVLLILMPAAAQQNSSDAAPGQKTPSADQARSVSDEVIQQVLEPLRTALQTQNIQLVLSLFDKSPNSRSATVEHQLQVFFQVFDEINFRYQLLQVTAEREHGSATADIQMDALPYDLTRVPVRRSVQMRLQLKLGPKGWKITGLTPADFFDVDYSGS